jgi:ABC-type multidrug transport system permease subunit
MALFRYERLDNTYSVFSFYFSYLIIELAFELVASAIFTLFAYFLTGMQITQFVLICAVIMCIVNVGESIGITFISIVGHVGASVQVMSGLMSILMMLTGFLSVST